MVAERTELIITEDRFSIAVDRESEVAKSFGYDGEYVVCKDYDNEKKCWVNGDYVYCIEDAFALLALRLGSSLVKSRSERRSGISYDRMSEIATRFKDACIESEDKEPLGYALEELDLTEKERKYFEIWDYAINEEDEDYDE